MSAKTYKMFRFFLKISKNLKKKLLFQNIYSTCGHKDNNPNSNLYMVSNNTF